MALLQLPQNIEQSDGRNLYNLTAYVFICPPVFAHLMFVTCVHWLIFISWSMQIPSNYAKHCPKGAFLKQAGNIKMKTIQICPSLQKVP